MANKRNCMVLLVIAISFAVSALSCNNVDKELNGTWIPVGGSSQSIMEYENGIFALSVNGLPYIKGTYTAKDNTSTRKITHYGKYFFDDLDSDWYTRDDLLKLHPSDASGLDLFLSTITIGSPVNYSVNGDTLTTSWEGGQGTSTRISRSTNINKGTNSSSRNSISSNPFIGTWTGSLRLYTGTYELEFFFDAGNTGAYRQNSGSINNYTYTYKDNVATVVCEDGEAFVATITGTSISLFIPEENATVILIKR